MYLNITDLNITDRGSVFPGKGKEIQGSKHMYTHHRPLPQGSHSQCGSPQTKNQAKTHNL